MHREAVHLMTTKHADQAGDDRDDEPGEQRGVHEMLLQQLKDIALTRPRSGVRRRRGCGPSKP